MDFINLDAVLTGLADRVTVHQANQFPKETRTSEAAGMLRQTLHNISQCRPRWVERNTISSKPEFNDAAIYPEAMAMLEHAAGWYRREVKNLNAHIHSCVNAGLDPKDVELSHNLADLPFPGVQFFRPIEIGFDRAELIPFLDANGIAHDLGEQDKVNTQPQAAPVVEPDSITSRQVATFFDGLPYSAENWPKRLSDTKWLQSAKIALGEVGGITGLWCPLILARLIHGHEKGREQQKTLEALNSRFKRNTALQPWRDAWNEHYALFIDAIDD